MASGCSHVLPLQQWKPFVTSAGVNGLGSPALSFTVATWSGCGRGVTSLSGGWPCCVTFQQQEPGSSSSAAW